MDKSNLCYKLLRQPSHSHIQMQDKVFHFAAMRSALFSAASRYNCRNFHNNLQQQSVPPRCQQQVRTHRCIYGCRAIYVSVNVSQAVAATVYVRVSQAVAASSGKCLCACICICLCIFSCLCKCIPGIDCLKVALPPYLPLNLQLQLYLYLKLFSPVRYIFS